MEAPGLRERKKLRTRQAILDAAFALFEASGFDGASVAEIAAAAEVSKPTLFAYFPTKEDLVLHRFMDGGRGSAQVVRDRADDTTPLAALRQDFLDRLADRDPLTGLNDTRAAVTFHNLLYSTPALMAHLSGYMIDQERDLAAALLASGEPGDEFTAHLIAAQVFSAQRILTSYNARAVRAGERTEDIYPIAVTRAETAFELLAHSLARCSQGAGG
ncbi:TetR/AcrR family transcriptional regulator [Nocardia brasiliensis]|uniref:TetR/AcrR family transcriptional regulator n=1 Tax=Nocardia brasiliensis TaxID=37326 RepID=UPI0018953F88|nr:TetR family transcriptional regulator [Nocardia brasiliensis]MBF6544899.1 TetR family transcriptional regulator [Nocardia brasiliensis]